MHSPTHIQYVCGADIDSDICTDVCRFMFYYDFNEIYFCFYRLDDINYKKYKKK